MAEPGGRGICLRLGQIFFIFMQFLGKTGQIIVGAPSGLASSLENPGSATDASIEDIAICLLNSSKIG